MITLEELVVPFSNNLCEHLLTAPKQVTSKSSQFLDAFHVVNGGVIPVEFYKTDEIFKLQDVVYFVDFMNEVESRWNLVETAWQLGVSRNVLNVKYDDENKLFFVNSDKLRHKDVTSTYRLFTFSIFNSCLNT